MWKSFALCLLAALSSGAAHAGGAPPLPEVASQVARELLSAIPKPPPGKVAEIVIDPLLDGRTGEQSEAGRTAGAAISALVATEYPQFRVVPFTPAALARSPILVMGAIASLDSVGQDAGGTKLASNEARPTGLWFTAADTKTHKVLARAKGKAALNSVDSRPVAAQADSPVWRPDARVQAYLKTCRKAKVGEEMDPAYVEQLDAAALLVEADEAQAGRRYAQSLTLYRKALGAPGGRQMRALNGMYVALDKLRRPKEAAQAFADLVDYSLEAGDMNVKLLFRPGAANFTHSAETRPYDGWISIIAERGAARGQCLELTGHTSPTGVASLNEQLSELRAEYVRDKLDRAKPGFGQRVITRGVGSREALIGTGRDDASDALDRRVEFKPLTCR